MGRRYIDKDTLVAEIERRVKYHAKRSDPLASAYVSEDDAILFFIDTLEVKEYSEKYDGFLGKELKMVDDEIEQLKKLKVKEVDLDWQDIYSILYLERTVLHEWGDREYSNEELCLEVLRRFKAQKGEEVCLINVNID